ncbi:MAG: hypothetical protein ACPGYY_10370, partial [Bacteroidia bacterium]
VFCLDATGSMSGLIGTAKEKIWDIVSGVSQSQDIGKIKLGMIFYRDRGDAFVTKSYPLTENIDSIYTELLAIGAGGGGDSPESVNAALDEAIRKMPWSDDGNAYRTVFLVGDCPPHMDYNETRYPATCKTASQKNILINTIKLGNQCSDAIRHFKEIARLTNGNFQQLDQNAKDYVIETPYDDSITYYSRRIDDSKIYYGTTIEKRVMYDKKAKSMDMYDKASKTSNRARASYNTSKAGKKNFYGKNELVQGLIDKEITLDSISVDKLPDEMKEMNIEQQKVYINNKTIQRQNDVANLNKYIKQKDEYVRIEKTKKNGESSFSEEIIKTMKSQAKK